MSSAKQIVAGLSASLGAFCLGSVIGWSSPVQKHVIDGEYGFSVTNAEFGPAGALMTLGGAFACIPVGIICGILGRKPTMLLLVLPFMIGWGCVIFPTEIMLVYVGRFLLGFSGGAFCICAPLYTTEVATVEMRGMMGGFFQLLIVIGILYSWVIGALLPKLLHINMAMGVFPLIFFSIFIWMPESPVFYIQKNRVDKAQASYARLRPAGYDPSKEIAEVQASLKGGGESQSLGALLCRKATMKGLFISLAMMLFQQLTGINAIMFYSTAIFEEAETGFSPAGSTIIIGVVQLVATLAAVAIIDRSGRRILLLLSALFMGLSTGAMAYYFHLKETDAHKSMQWLPVASVTLFIIFFSLGFGPVPWLIMAELFSEDVKGFACSLSGTFNWLLAFCVTFAFPLVKDALGPSIAFLIFAAVGAVAFVFILLLVPETKGKTLNEIQQILS